jgi:hypothetical protein
MRGGATMDYYKEALLFTIKFRPPVVCEVGKPFIPQANTLYVCNVSGNMNYIYFKQHLGGQLIGWLFEVTIGELNYGYLIEEGSEIAFSTTICSSTIKGDYKLLKVSDYEEPGLWCIPANVYDHILDRDILRVYPALY